MKITRASELTGVTRTLDLPVTEDQIQVWLDGFGEVTYGSCQEEGCSATRVITDKMIYCDELGRQVDEVDVKPLIGILEETNQGFIDYELFPTEKAARARWEDLTNMWEGLYHPEAAYA